MIVGPSQEPNLETRAPDTSNLSLLGGMAERTKATVLKTVEPLAGSLGSNPSPSAERADLPDPGSLTLPRPCIPQRGASTHQDHQT